jgi:hypothetical protein
MEFFCVLSVGGSLASYKVKTEDERTFQAVLHNNHGDRTDIPSQLFLCKKEADWQVNPVHDKVVKSLINAIEMDRQE